MGQVREVVVDSERSGFGRESLQGSFQSEKYYQFRESLGLPLSSLVPRRLNREERWRLAEQTNEREFPRISLRIFDLFSTSR